MKALAARTANITASVPDVQKRTLSTEESLSESIRALKSALMGCCHCGTQRSLFGDGLYHFRVVVATNHGRPVVGKIEVVIAIYIMKMAAVAPLHNRGIRFEPGGNSYIAVRNVLASGLDYLGRLRGPLPINLLNLVGMLSNELFP